MTENTERPKTECIFRIDRYTDNAGRVVEERCAVKGVPEEGFVRFLGHSNVVIHDQRTHQPIGQQPIMFAIDATDLQGAFDQFDALGEKAAQDTMAQIEESRRKQHSGIVVPGQKRHERPEP